MVIFSEISKYASKLLLMLFLAFFLISALFLYKPSYFLHNIENHLSNSLESYLLNVEVKINDIEGNFFSGFNIASVEIVDGSSASLIIRSIDIIPSLKDIFYGNVIFKSIKIGNLEVDNISSFGFNDKFRSKKNILIPELIVEEIIIDSGFVKHQDFFIFLSGNFNINMESEKSYVDIENLNITFNDKVYYLDEGLINFENENVSFKDFTISNENTLIGHFNMNLDLFPLQINHSNLLLNGLDFSIYDNFEKRSFLALNLSLRGVTFYVTGRSNFDIDLKEKIIIEGFFL